MSGCLSGSTLTSSRVRKPGGECHYQDISLQGCSRATAATFESLLR